MVVKFYEGPQSIDALIVRELLGHFYFFFDLRQALASGDQFGDFVAHDHEVALLFFKIFDAPVRRARARGRARRHASSGPRGL